MVRSFCGKAVQHLVPRPVAFLAVSILLAFLATPAQISEAAEAPQTRNRVFHTYDYACAGFSPTANLGTSMIGERHYVYQGWNYDESWDGGRTWHYAYSWVYPFGQAGPAKITKQWEYVAGFSSLRPCPAR